MLGHMNLLASEWLPAYILCLVRATGAGGRRRTGYTLAAVGALLLLLLCDWQSILFAALFTLCYVPARSIARRALAPLIVAASIGTLWLILAAPLLLPTIAQARSGDTIAPTEGQVQQYGADLLDFIRPTQFATFWRPLGRIPGEGALQPSSAGGVFLGFLPLILAAIALWRAPRRAWPWAGLALIFAVLALGPSLAIGDVDRGVPLPYALVGLIPLLNIARVPNRLVLVVTLCLAILAGLALVSLRQRFGARIGTRARLVLTILLAAALLAEHLAVPFPMEAISAPPFYRQLAASPEPGTILEIPYCKQCSITNYRQTVHGRPVIGGYISRRLLYPVRDSPLFREILPPGEDMTPGVEQAAIGRQILAYAGVRWIVIIRDDPDYDPDHIAQFLARFAAPTPLYRYFVALGVIAIRGRAIRQKRDSTYWQRRAKMTRWVRPLPPYNPKATKYRYEDAAMIVYRPAAPPAGIDRFIAPVSGWQEAEHASDTGSRMRWFAEAGTDEAWNFSGADRTYTLRFDTASYRTPRRLAIMLDNRSLGQWTIDSARQIAIPLTLSPGSHLFTFRSLDPSLSPNDVDPRSDDDRQLAIAVADLTLNTR